jgi:hypothetical protein
MRVQAMGSEHPADFLCMGKTAAHHGNFLCQCEPPHQRLPQVEILNYNPTAGGKHPNDFRYDMRSTPEMVQRIDHKNPREAPVREW